MAFDKTAWDPSPLQLTFTGFAASWIFAITIEYFLLNQNDVIGCITLSAACLFGFEPLNHLWPPLLLFVVLPFALMLSLISIFRRNRRYKRAVLLLGTILWTVLLVWLDLDLRGEEILPSSG